MDVVESKDWDSGLFLDSSMLDTGSASSHTVWAPRPVGTVVYPVLFQFLFGWFAGIAKYLSGRRFLIIQLMSLFHFPVRAVIGWKSLLQCLKVFFTKYVVIRDRFW